MLPVLQRLGVAFDLQLRLRIVLKLTFTERNFNYGLVFTPHLVRLNVVSELLHAAQIDSSYSPGGAVVLVVSELLLVVNSSANFVVYVAFGRRFRRILRDTFQFSFRFSGGATAVTHDHGGGGAAHRLQYHHNCVHVHKLHHHSAAAATPPHCRTAAVIR